MSKGCKYESDAEATIRQIQCEKAIAFLERMNKDGLHHDTYTFNVLMSLNADRRDFDAAWNVFKEMEAHKVEPDVVTFNNLIKAAEQTSRKRERFLI